MPRAAIVRQVAALERGALAREELGELAMRLGVRAIAAAGREGAIVEPEEIAAVRARRPAQAARDRAPPPPRRPRRAARARPGAAASPSAGRSRRRPSRRPGRSVKTASTRPVGRRAPPRPRSRGRRAARRTPRAGARAAPDRARASRQPRSRPAAPATRRARAADVAVIERTPCPLLVDGFRGHGVRLVHRRRVTRGRTAVSAFAMRRQVGGTRLSASTLETFPEDEPTAASHRAPSATRRARALPGAAGRRPPRVPRGRAVREQREHYRRVPRCSGRGLPHARGHLRPLGRRGRGEGRGALGLGVIVAARRYSLARSALSVARSMPCGFLPFTRWSSSLREDRERRGRRTPA